MIIFGSCVQGDGSRYRSVALPGIERVALPDDLIISSSGDDSGISTVYNAFIETARSRPDCEALVLLHDDVELTDANLRGKVLSAADEPNVGVAGVVGGSGLTSISWWDARRTAGKVYETRWFLDLGECAADVHAVDGLFMVIAPRAFQRLSFDPEAFPRFHGYDIDFCMQARAAGLRVVVRPVNLFHRTKAALGDERAFEYAGAALAHKWPTMIVPLTPVERARQLEQKGAIKLRRAGRGAKRRLARYRRGSTPQQVAAGPAQSPPELALAVPSACAACGEQLGDTERDQAPTLPTIRVCQTCGTGATWPPPGREIESDGIWVERYGAARIERRDLWFDEAGKRLDWIELFLPEGLLLEIGSGTGEFLKVAQDEGFEAHGIEPSSWAAAQAAQLGVDVTAGYLDEWSSRHADYLADGVAMWHVLEHIPDPYDFLGGLRSVTCSSGFLFIEVPNFASTEAARLGVEWDSAQPNDHFHHFTPQGLATLLERSGFEVLDVIPMTSRVYDGVTRWRDKHHDALLGGHAWPPLDLLRIRARPHTGA